MSLTRQNKFLLIAIGLVLAVIGGFILSRGSEHATAQAEPTEFSLAVLDQPADPEVIEQQPAVVQEQLEFAVDSVESRSSGSSVEVEALGESTIPGEGTVSVAEISDEVCAFERSGVGNCGEEPEINQGDIYTATPINCAKYEVLGVVGNEVATILVSPKNRPSYVIDVHENMYLGDFAAVQTVITGRDAEGNTVFETVLPLDEFRQLNCGKS